MAVKVGSSAVIVVPSPVGKTQPDTARKEEWRLAVVSLKEALFNFYSYSKQKSS